APARPAPAAPARPAPAAPARPALPGPKPAPSAARTVPVMPAAARPRIDALFEDVDEDTAGPTVPAGARSLAAEFPTAPYQAARSPEPGAQARIELPPPGASADDDDEAPTGVE